MPVRIVGLADTLDAMTSARPYREPLSIGGARQRNRSSGSAKI